MAEESITDTAMKNLRRQGFKGTFLDMERQRLVKKLNLNEKEGSALSIKDLYAKANEKPWNVKR